MVQDSPPPSGPIPDQSYDLTSSQPRVSASPSVKSKLVAILVLIALFILILLSYISLTRGAGKSINSTKQSLPSPEPTITLPPEGAFVPDQLIIRFRKGQAIDAMLPERKQIVEQVFSRAGVLSWKASYTPKDPNFVPYYVLQLKPESDLQKSTSILETLAEIEIIEFNFKMRAVLNDE